MSSRSRQSRRPRGLAIAAAVLIVLIIGIWLGGHPSWMPSSLRSAFVDQGSGRLTSQVLDMLSRDYYRPINKKALENKGLSAIVASLSDPYSHYYDPTAYKSFLNQSNPHLSGIGIDVLPNARGLQVVDVFPGSPAARAGLTRGDLIVQVGSTSLANRSPAFSSGLIQGKAGTPVTLTIVRGGRRLAKRIIRANLVIPVATGNLVNYHGTKIGALQLTSFTQGAGVELRSRVQKLLRGGARALILDLRENGGGLLDEAVNVASIFVPDGTIVSTDGRSQPRQVYVAKGNAIASRIPMVVLVDRGTASAAEIVTGALKDRGRAKVVGTRTYGKGVFQEIEPLPNGGALDITVGEYFTPNGTNLGGGGVREGTGIRPDVSAIDNPHTTHVDEALQVAERTVAAELR
jgi:carboxyl-terminal processing protease